MTAVEVQDEDALVGERQESGEFRCLIDGSVAVMVVELFTVNVVAGVAPKFTADAPVKFVPATVTKLPDGPLTGSTLVMVGGGGGRST